jgi:hypothetical protein
MVQEGFGRTTVKTTKVRIGAMLAAMIVAGGTLAGALATQDGGQPTGATATNHETVQDAGEPILYAGSYGLFPSK